MSLRFFALFGLALLLAGCGVSAASSPTPTPAAEPTPVVPSGAKFNHAPPMTINPSHYYSASLATTDGTFVVQLFPKIAPLAVNSFVFLAKHHYYDHNLFHRIIQEFMIQTGDPTGTGFGGPGYVFRDEPVRGNYLIGTVAMANRGPNSNGSQFFIVTGPRGLGLPKQYTIFGRVIRGLNVVMKIAHTPVTRNIGTDDLSEPLTPVYVKHVTIHESR